MEKASNAEKIRTHITVKIGQSGKYCTLEFGHALEREANGNAQQVAAQQRADILAALTQAEPQVNQLLRSLGLEGEWRAAGTDFNQPVVDIYLPPPAPLLPSAGAPPPPPPPSPRTWTIVSAPCEGCGMMRSPNAPCPDDECPTRVPS